MDANILLAAASLLLFVLLIAFFGFVIYHQQQVEPEEKPVYGIELLEQHYAPGATVEQPTPYWVAPIPSAPDPLEISGNLDRKIVAGGAMLFALIGLVGGYFLLQIVPNANLNLRALGAERQLHTSIDRGKNLFANFCYPCHGKLGLGNGENDVNGKPLPGKPLNKPDFKVVNMKDDPAKQKSTEDFLRLRITRGKQNPPPNFSMPAWGQADGGPFNDEQVNQLIALIMHGSDADWADIQTIREHLENASRAPDPGPPPAKPTGDAAFAQYCTTCHSADPTKPSTITTAPNLGRYGVEGPLNDQLKALKASGDPDWLFKWVANAPSIKPGIIMPVWLDRDGGSLDEATVRTIVDYLMTLGK